MLLRSTARELRAQGGRQFRDSIDRAIKKVESGADEAAKRFESSSAEVSKGLVETGKVLQADLDKSGELASNTRERITSVNNEVRALVATLKSLETEAGLVSRGVQRSLEQAKDHSDRAISKLTDPGVSVGFVVFAAIACLVLLIIHSAWWSAHGDSPYARAILFLGGSVGMSAFTMLMAILCGCTTRVY